METICHQEKGNTGIMNNTAGGIESLVLDAVRK